MNIHSALRKQEVVDQHLTLLIIWIHNDNCVRSMIVDLYLANHSYRLVLEVIIENSLFDFVDGDESTGVKLGNHF